MSGNIAALTAQAIRHRLVARGWHEAKSQHFRFRREEGGDVQPTAIEVGYVLGECTVKFVPLDSRGTEGAMHNRGRSDIERGVGPDFIALIMERAEEEELA